MNIQTVLTHDKVKVKCRSVINDKDYEWIVLIMPFGLTVHLADAFFNFFANSYNIVTWEARAILADESDPVNILKLTFDSHSQDAISIMDKLDVKRAYLVGYCSGAGIALNIAFTHPQRFNKLSLINGEYVLRDDPNCTTQYSNDISNILPLVAESETMAQLIIDKIQLEDRQDVPAGINLPFSTAYYLHRYGVNFMSYQKVDFLQLAKRIKLKTQLVTGELDLQANANSTLKMASYLNCPKICINPEGDHYDFLREKSNTLINILEFLQENDE